MEEAEKKGPIKIKAPKRRRPKTIDYDPDMDGESFDSSDERELDGESFDSGLDDVDVGLIELR